MNQPPKPLSAAEIHSAYSNTNTPIRKTTADDAKYRATTHFIRDPAHSGRTPNKSKIEKGPFRRP